MSISEFTPNETSDRCLVLLPRVGMRLAVSSNPRSPREGQLIKLFVEEVAGYG